ncbi:MAG: hypothetical protein WCC12_13010, partial [Anaerolineales bacterium]
MNADQTVFSNGVLAGTAFIRGYQWWMSVLRDCFLKTLWDTDTTDLPCGYDVTEFHGKNRNKKAPFRGFRE